MTHFIGFLELEKQLLKWIEVAQEIMDNQPDKASKAAFSNQIIAYKNVLIRIKPGYAAQWAEEERAERQR